MEILMRVVTQHKIINYKFLKTCSLLEIAGFLSLAYD